MKTIRNRALCLLLGTAMLFPMATGALAATSAESAAAASGIYVSATGEIEAEPDYAVVSLGVNTTEETSAKARNVNATTLAKVTAALKKQGVAEKDIKNEYVNMYTEYDYTSGKQTISGYTVSNSLSIYIRNLDKLGETVNAALEAGANNLSNVYYEVNNRDAYYAKAVKKAMDSARKKADIIAKEAGLTLGAVTSVNESGYDYPSYGGGYAVMAEDANAKAVSDIGNTLKPSPVSISVSLNVSFTVK